MSIPNISEFFLGCNTPQGFVGRLEQLTSPSRLDMLYLLKGGAGSGKSTIIKKIAQKALELGEDIELIRCSSDFDSLDGIILPERKTAVFDGTLPHAIEPKYVGAFEQIVNLTEALDAKGIHKHREEILQAITRNATYHQQCVRYLGGAVAILEDNYRIAYEATDFTKIKRTTALLANKILPKKHIEHHPIETCRLLSAVTDQGYALLPTPEYKTYLLEDPYGAVSAALLSELRSIALELGYDVCNCYSPFAPFERLEHLIIPEVGVLFTSKNLLHSPAQEPLKVISYKRFTDLELIRKYKKRILFNKKAAASMIEQAAQTLSEAKQNHDLIEEAYRPHIDFAVTTQIGDELLATIFG